jgi:hypothetical protein
LRPRAIDGSTIQGPASKGTEWRLHYTLDLITLACDWHEVTDAKQAELLERAPVRPGDVLIADRNYLRSVGVRSVVDRGGHVLVRMRWTHPPLDDGSGRRVHALSVVRGLRVGKVGQWPVELVDGEQPIKGRIIALRLPHPVAERAIQRLRQRANRRQKELDPRSIEAARYVMLFTTLPETLLDADAVAELYRFRWQIELAFKRHKQLLRLGLLPHQDPATAQSWLLAKLVLALLLETIYRTATSISPWGYRFAHFAQPTA